MPLLTVFLLIIFSNPAFTEQEIGFDPIDNNPNGDGQPPTTANNTTYQCNEIYPVQLGLPVTFSSRHSNHDCSIFRLDIPNYAWSAQLSDSKQWIQITSMKPQLWKGVITQGRSNADQWVEEYRVSYTIDGDKWEFVDGGSLFEGNNDRNTLKREEFSKPVFGRAIRIHPTKWMNHISMRFQAVIVN